uniref:Protein YIPF n=2 Tax=Plectus sambesii TaxID=2011161 RepID=A0A914W8X4_9BILA
MTDLEFQSFHNQVVTNVQPIRDDDGGTTYEFQHSGDIDRVKLLDSENGTNSTPQGNKNLWSFEYYQQFFDVDTDQVMGRLLNSMVPRLKTNFIAQHIHPIPDLYGPFWICVTLIFTTGICGNLAKYIETAGSTINGHFESDFHLVTGAASAIFSYVTLVPFGLYSLLWYRKSEVQYTYLEILSAYGYSLTVFVPVSILWVIQLESVRWALIVVAVCMSGFVLAFSFWPAVRGDKKLIAFGTIVGILGLHAILAIGFKEFFFDAALQSNKFGADNADFSSGALDKALTDPAPNAALTLNDSQSKNAKGAEPKAASNKADDKESSKATANGAPVATADGGGQKDAAKV